MRNRYILVCWLYALLLDSLVEGHEELLDKKLIDPQPADALEALAEDAVLSSDSVTHQAAANGNKNSFGQKTVDLGRPPASPPLFPSFSPFEALNLHEAAVEQAEQAAATPQTTESPRPAAAAPVPPQVQPKADDATFTRTHENEHQVHDAIRKDEVQQQPREMKVIVTPQTTETPRPAAAAQLPPEMHLPAEVDAAFMRASMENDRHAFDTMRNNEVQQRLREIEARYERERLERENQRGSIWTQALGRLFGFGSSSNTRGANARSGVHESASERAQAALRAQAGANMGQRGDIPMPHRAAAMGARMGESAGFEEASKTRRTGGVQGDASSFFFVPVLVALVFAYFVYSFIKVTRGKRSSKRKGRKSGKRGVFGFGKSRRSSSSTSSDSDDDLLGSSSASGMFNPAVLAAISAVAQQRASQTNTGAPNPPASATSPPPADKQPQAQAHVQPEAPVKPVASPSGSAPAGENANAFVGKDVKSMSLDELVELQRALLEETLKRQQVQTTQQSSEASSPEQPTASSSDEFGLRKRVVQSEPDAPAESSSK